MRKHIDISRTFINFLILLKQIIVNLEKFASYQSKPKSIN